MKVYTVTDELYGTWEITSESVAKDWRKDRAQYENKPLRDIPMPDEETIECWFYEQISWSEISRYGVQVKPPNLEKLCKSWMCSMKYDCDIAANQ